MILRLFQDDIYWIAVKDGHPIAVEIFKRHYSKYHYADGRDPNRIVGPGERIVMIGKNNDALFVWRKFIDASGQQGVNCAVFRNEGEELSSGLILQAERIAGKRWPGQRLYTYVNPRKVKSKKNPGWCFICAGWNYCGLTKKRKLLIFEKIIQTG